MVLSSLSTCSLEHVAASAPGRPAGCRSTSCTIGLARTTWSCGRPPMATARLSSRSIPSRAFGWESDGAASTSRTTWSADPGRRQHAQGPRGRVHGRGDPGSRTALTPADIGWLAGLTALPVVVKGVQRADDALRCVDAGAAALIVSNHGARQLSDAPPSADILAECSTPLLAGPRSTSTGACAGRPTWSRHSRSVRGPCWSVDPPSGRWRPGGPTASPHCYGGTSRITADDGPRGDGEPSALDRSLVRRALP